jgi:hypothetical protein
MTVNSADYIKKLISYDRPPPNQIAPASVQPELGRRLQEDQERIVPSSVGARTTSGCFGGIFSCAGGQADVSGVELQDLLPSARLAREMDTMASSCAAISADVSRLQRNPALTPTYRAQALAPLRDKAIALRAEFDAVSGRVRQLAQEAGGHKLPRAWADPLQRTERAIARLQKELDK